MITVLVTGANGFIGKNLCVQLERDNAIKLLRFEHRNTIDELKLLVQEADFIFHLAGINRPKNKAEFDAGNRALTEELVALIKASGRKMSLLTTSSIQAELDNPYGRSKLAAEEAVFKWAKSTGNKAYVYRLPNVFGKWCLPKYNSVVATFCHSIANGEEITINDPATELTLVYIDDVINNFIATMNGDNKIGKDGYCYVPKEFTVTLKELADKIYGFKQIRDTITVPDFAEELDRDLYATFTSYFRPEDFEYPLDMKRDDRGWLSEFIKSEHAGQIFISRTKPGISRGNHWHHTKIEKFLVVSGQADIKFRHLQTGETVIYKVNGDNLKVVDIPAGYVHSIANTGEEDLLTLFWSDEVFNPEHPDTYYEEV